MSKQTASDAPVENTMKKVSYAKTHSDIFIPGIGSLTQTLPPQTRNVHLDMFQSVNGLLLKASFQGVKAQAVIPYANVVLMVLDPSEVVTE